MRSRILFQLLTLVSVFFVLGLTADLYGAGIDYKVDDLPEASRGLYQSAMRLMNEDRFEEAVGLFEQVLERHPDHVATLANIGAAYSALGDNLKSLEYLERAMRLSLSDTLEEDEAPPLPKSTPSAKIIKTSVKVEAEERPPVEEERPVDQEKSLRPVLAEKEESRPVAHPQYQGQETPPPDVSELKEKDYETVTIGRMTEVSGVELQTCRLRQFGFEMLCNEEWVMDMKENKIMIRILQRPLVMIVLSRIRTPFVFIEDMDREFLESSEVYSGDIEVHPRRFDGRPARLVEAVSGQNEEMFRHDYYFVDGPVLYGIFFSVTPLDQFEEYRELIEEVAGSFHLL